MFGKKRKTPSLEKSMRLLERQIERMERLEGRVDRLDSNDSYFQEQLYRHEQAAGGGFWKTAKGHLLRIRDMSTDHIKRCLAGNFAKPNGLARGNMERELGRRDEEAYWRAQPMPVEETTDGLPDDRMAYVCTVKGVPIYVANTTSVNEVMAVGLVVRRGQGL